MRKRRRFTIVLAGLAVLAGCTSGGQAAEPAPSTTTLSEVEILALAKEVADCIRANGLPGFPDPYFENGELQLPPVDANVESQGQALLEGVCGQQWQRLEAALPERNQEGDGDKPTERRPMSAEDLEKLKRYTECARGNGLPTFPDPDETGHYHLGSAGLPTGLGKDNRPEDATFRNVLEVCREFQVPGMGFTNE